MSAPLRLVTRDSSVPLTDIDELRRRVAENEVRFCVLLFVDRHDQVHTWKLGRSGRIETLGLVADAVSTLQELFDAADPVGGAS